MIIDKEAMIQSFEIYSKDIVAEIIDIFITEYPERITNLEKSIADSDADLLRSTAHGFKGVISHFSAQEPLLITKEMEIKGKDGDFSGMSELLDQLITCCDQMLIEMEQIKQEHYS
ncbi:MAG: Hpt domain-containing protein [Bacteroidales bacterium]|nr:Hpt domain-containing protein [Bacteroidales bacterium]